MAKSPPEGATTWGRFHRAEGDPKRDKRWCLNYRKSDGWCAKIFMQCTGSVQCKYYSPDDEHAAAPIVKRVTVPQRKPVEKFQGVKTVDISLISISPKALVSPKIKHIEYFEGVFKKTGKVDPPITVSCNGSYYQIEDGYSRFFAAHNLGFKEIPIEIGTREDNDFKKKLKVGTKVKYASNEEGIIINKTDKTITIKYPSREMTLDIALAIKSKGLKII